MGRAIVFNDADVDEIHNYISFLTTFLGLFAVPFIILNVPMLGSFTHQLRPTAFDQAGGLRLAMSLEQMKKKYNIERKAKRGVANCGNSLV
eukprot:CAMPEP_0119341000 /NCGR_PEP_ID=MMETSP1333-20130426/101452_1 /TAXON_ID=418940 /ORGANISM="Scyphosphaera apsteinii, Strain RCC1455" /LENGTH=90 /DNA_ID=CAMNT_0007352875 /DNA_START=283 /DNA_END=555 /DNA_ORIENTATION=+